jgi:hypothetical protein
MITLPVAVHNDFFKWQLDLFWHNHKLTYKHLAKHKTMAIIIKRNNPQEQKIEQLQWDTDIPHIMCESFFDILGSEAPGENHVPLNIQIGLQQILSRFNDDEIIEIIDCDMFHFRHHPFIDIEDDEIIVDDIYEPWHLKSLSTNRKIIEIYFENGGRFYNGGFVPIIAKAKTFRKILPQWIAVHIDIAKRNYSGEVNWWAGMFSLQVACEKNKVRMIAKDWCYVPGINQLTDKHYIAHYSCSYKFNKKTFPSVDVTQFEHNVFFDRLRSWPRLSNLV